MVIKNFKQFESSVEGVEYTSIDNTKNANYILGLPSGEVIMINDINILKSLVDLKLISYIDQFAGLILNCYCAQDKNIEKVKTTINKIKSEDTNDEEYINICREYRDEIMKIIKKRHVIAHYVDGRGVKYYYAIIPDLNISTIYKKYINELVDIIKEMKKRYPSSIFSLTERLTKPRIKYFGVFEN